MNNANSTASPCSMTKLPYWTSCKGACAALNRTYFTGVTRLTLLRP